MKKRLIFILFTFILLGTIAFFYVRNVLLPVKFKAFLVSKLSQALERQVSVDSIDFNLLEGVKIKNIIIQEKDLSQNPLAQIDEISFNLAFPNFFKSHQIILPFVRIKNPTLRVTRYPDATWNFSDFLKSRDPSGKSNPFKFIVLKLGLENGRVDIYDQTRGDFIEAVREINVQAGMRVTTQKINANIQAKIPQTETMIQTQATYDLKDRELAAQISVQNLYPLRYIPFFPKQEGLEIASGFIPNADVTIGYQKNMVALKGNFSLAHVDATYLDQHFAGSLEAKDILLKKQNQDWQGQGTLHFPSIHFAQPQGLTFDTQATIRLASLKATADQFSVDGDVQAQQIKLDFPPDQTWETPQLSLLNFSLKGQGPQATGEGTIEIPQCRLILSGGNELNMDVKPSTVIFSKNDQQIELKGRYVFDNTHLTVNPQTHLTGNIVVDNVLASWDNNKFAYQSELAVNDAALTMGEYKMVNGQLALSQLTLGYDQTSLDVGVEGRLTDGKGQMGKITVTASPQFAVKAKISPQGLSAPQYAGSILLTKANISGVPQINSIDDLTGQIDFQSDQISTDKMTLRIFEQPLTIAGSVSQFTNPQANVTIAADRIPFKNLGPILKMLPSPLPFQLIDGDASVEGTYHGPVNAPAQAAIDLTSEVHDTTISFPQLPGPISAISGTLRYRGDTLAWQKFSGTYKNQTYTSDGEASNLLQPMIKATIASSKFNISAEVKKTQDLFEINSLTGNYLNSQVSMNGGFRAEAGNPPFVDIKGIAELNLNDLNDFSSLLPFSLKTIDPQGLLKLSFTLKGLLSDWRQAQVNVQGNASEITLQGHALTDVRLMLTQAEGRVEPLDLKAKFYEGDVSVSSSLDLTK
ncbi:MAG: hypothetical protein Q7S13_02135, partial [Candidatus Omnitrophota bacterium]|nr:hypothetical protein [Candidatus Omnitrophota bacterium]